MSGVLGKIYAYHAWANRDLFAVLETLDPTENQAALHNALRTVNHYHVVARIFAGHLSGVPHGYRADNTQATPSLADLRADLTACDQWYQDYVAGLSAERLAENIAFTFTDGDRGWMSREEMLTHVALHAGYHRGEVGRMLKQISIVPPWDTYAVHLHRTTPERRWQEHQNP